MNVKTERHCRGYIYIHNEISTFGHIFDQNNPQQDLDLYVIMSFRAVDHSRGKQVHTN